MDPAAFTSSVITQCRNLPDLGKKQVLGLTDQGRVVICSEDSAADEDVARKALMMTFVSANHRECEWLKVRKRDVFAIEGAFGPFVGKASDDSVLSEGSGTGSDEPLGAVGGDHPEAPECSVVTDIPDGMYVDDTNNMCEENFDVNNDELYQYIRSANRASFDFVSYTRKRMNGALTPETAGKIAESINNELKKLMETCEEDEQQSVKSECYKAIFNSFCNWLPLTNLRFKLDEKCCFYSSIRNVFATLTLPETGVDEFDPTALASANDFTTNVDIRSSIREKYQWLSNIDNLLPPDEYLENASHAQFGQDVDEVRGAIEGFIKSSIYRFLPPEVTAQVRGANCLDNDTVDDSAIAIIQASLNEGFFETRYDHYLESDAMSGLDELPGVLPFAHMMIHDGQLIFLVNVTDD